MVINFASSPAMYRRESNYDKVCWKPPNSRHRHLFEVLQPVEPPHQNGDQHHEHEDDLEGGSLEADQLVAAQSMPLEADTRSRHSSQSGWIIEHHLW